MQSTSVWIIHDTLHMILLLRNAIALHGYTNVNCFTNGKEALDSIWNGLRPDVVIVKDDLTGMSGNDFLALADAIYKIQIGVLLVSLETNSYSSRYLTIVEGAAGFHESLMQVLTTTANNDSLESVEQLVLTNHG